jgi:type I restriction enzyme S subunit
MSKQWPKVKLCEVLTPTARGESVDASKEYRLLGIRLDGQGPFLRETVMGTQTSATRLFRVAENDFIYSRLFACRGAFGVISKELDGCFVSSEFPAFVPVPGKIDVEYLKYWFRLPSVIATVDADCSGSTPLTRNRFKENFFLALEIPLPPLAEQRRVVARIEELAAQIHEARTLRHQAAEETEHFKSKVAADVFDAVKAEKKALGEIATKKTGAAYRADDFVESGGVPVVRLKEIQTQKPTIFLRNPDDYSNVWLEKGDIILAKTSFSTGAMCQWPGPRAVLNQNAVMLRADEGVEQRYLFEWLGQQVNRYLADHLADPNFYPYIRESELIRWQIPIPPLTEQRRIVDELDALQAEVDALKRLQAQTATELDALLPAILDRAFKGEL